MRWALGVVCLVIGAGCTSGPQESHVEQQFRPPAERLLIDQLALTEEKLVSCMKALGFDYRGRPRSEIEGEAIRRVQQEGDTAAERRAIASDTGFGLAEQLLNDLRSPVEPGANTDPDDWEAHNAHQALESAFSAALQGSEERPGCVQKANAEVSKELELHRFEAIDRRVAASISLLTSDRRAIELAGRWSACMADMGHSYSDFGDPERDLISLANDVSHQINADIESGLERAVEKLGAGLTSQDLVSAESLNALAEFRRTEIAVAIADTQCREPIRVDLERLTEEYLGGLLAERDALAEDLGRR